ncbi:MAG TPA: hypothetical protein VK900_17270, partial [Anaerolineales bacterium]|nr:hypothetical protein [Anaerolineales bacterium]
MRITRSVRIVVMLTSGLLLTSCLLPGMIPLNPTPDAPMPVMETDSQALLETIKSGNWVYLEALAEEQYAEEDYAGPGTL